MRQPPILMYHWFRPEGALSRSRSPQLEITPERFRRQMRALERAGYQTISLSRAVHADADAPLPAKPVVITFDDGTADFWAHARPALEDVGFKATLFVVTDHVGRASDWDEVLGEPARPTLDWEQIAELQRAGHEIGSHTHRHRVFTELDDDDVRSELSESRDAIERRLGRAPEFLAYPRGFFEPRHRRLVREAGYAGACAVVLSWRDLVRGGTFELRRMTVKGHESMLRFWLRLNAGKHVRPR